ncbi:MAG: hypothetical protein ACPGUD_10980 [Parashewanella sp.]
MASNPFSIQAALRPALTAASVGLPHSQNGAPKLPTPPEHSDITSKTAEETLQQGAGLKENLKQAHFENNLATQLKELWQHILGEDEVAYEDVDGSKLEEEYEVIHLLHIDEGKGSTNDFHSALLSRDDSSVTKLEELLQVKKAVTLSKLPSPAKPNAPQRQESFCDISTLTYDPNSPLSERRTENAFHVLSSVSLPDTLNADKLALLFNAVEQPALAQLDSANRTPVEVATQYWQSPCYIVQLLKRGNDPIMAAKIFQKAVMQNRKALVEALLEQRQSNDLTFDINYQNQYLQTSLHLAASKPERLGLVKLLHQQAGIDLTLTDCNGKRADEVICQRRGSQLSLASISRIKDRIEGTGKPTTTVFSA